MPFDDRGFSQVAEDLAVVRAARASLGRRGSWCREAFAHVGGQRCAVGWLSFHLDPAVHGGDFVPDILVNEVVGLVERCFVGLLPIEPGDEIDGVSLLIDFNDSSARKARVERLFDRVIERLEGSSS